MGSRKAKVLPEPASRGDQLHAANLCLTLILHDETWLTTSNTGACLSRDTSYHSISYGTTYAMYSNDTLWYHAPDCVKMTNANDWLC